MKRRTGHAVFASDGFTIVELMFVVAIIGVLVAVAMPVFFANTANVRKKACFGQQRSIDAAVSTWSSSNASPANTLAGVIDGSHRLIVDGVFRRAPRCPSAPEPVDPANPDPSTGAYTLDANADLAPCLFGTLGAHGSYQ